MQVLDPVNGAAFREVCEQFDDRTFALADTESVDSLLFDHLREQSRIQPAE